MNIDFEMVCLYLTHVGLLNIVRIHYQGDTQMYRISYPKQNIEIYRKLNLVSKNVSEIVWLERR